MQLYLFFANMGCIVLFYRYIALFKERATSKNNIFIVAYEHLFKIYLQVFAMRIAETILTIDLQMNSNKR